ncbi:MAG TPA: hypothetical protein VIJ75_23150 [Hanamia sp.]
MIQKLKECHQIEQIGDDEVYCTMEDMSYAVAPLYKRGLIEVRKSVVDNKTLHCIFITQAGRDYLKNLKN